MTSWAERRKVARERAAELRTHHHVVLVPWPSLRVAPCSCGAKVEARSVSGSFLAEVHAPSEADAWLVVEAYAMQLADEHAGGVAREPAQAFWSRKARADGTK